MKKVQILIISLVIILVLGCATFATLYFATDIFKSEKEMFYKYISQINITQITDTNFNSNYQTRLQNESYINGGTIDIKVQEDGALSFDESFSFNSKVDPVNGLASSIIDIKKDGQELLTVDYLRNKDLYGLKFEEIVSQYVVFENNNLKEFAAKFAVQDTSNIPDKIDLSEMLQNVNQEDINLEKLKSIGDKYVNLIIEEIKNLPAERYSKIEDGYKLTIDIKNLQNIYLKLLNTVKNDEQIFNLINSIISTMDFTQAITFEEYGQAFEELIEEISGENSAVIEEITYQNVIDVIAYKDGKIYVKMGIDMEDAKSYIDVTVAKNGGEINFKLNKVTKTYYQDEEMSITINKNINSIENDECKIQMIMKEEQEEIVNANILITRNGKLDSSNIKNSLIATIIAPEQNLEISMEYNNDKTFDSNLEIEEFNNGNHVIINKLDYTQIENLMTNLGNLILEKTGLGIGEIVGTLGIGLITTNPIEIEETALVSGVLALSNVFVTVNSATSILNSAKDAAQETQNSMESQEAEVFNSQFLAYEGLQKGTTIEMLKRRVTASNSSDSEHSVGYTNIEIDSSKTYNVSFQKNTQGYINMIIIEEQ